MWNFADGRWAGAKFCVAPENEDKKAIKEKDSGRFFYRDTVHPFSIPFSIPLPELTRQFIEELPAVLVQLTYTHTDNLTSNSPHFHVFGLRDEEPERTCKLHTGGPGIEPATFLL